MDTGQPYDGDDTAEFVEVPGEDITHKMERLARTLITLAEARRSATEFLQHTLIADAMAHVAWLMNPLNNGFAQKVSAEIASLPNARENHHA